MAAARAARGSGSAPAPQAQEPQAVPPRGVEGAQGDWARHWEAVTDSLGREGPPPGDEGVSVAELGHLKDHQGVEELALRCHAPPKGQAETRRCPLGGWVAQEDHEGSSGP